MVKNDDTKINRVTENTYIIQLNTYASEITFLVLYGLRL